MMFELEAKCPKDIPRVRISTIEAAKTIHTTMNMSAYGGIREDDDRIFPCSLVKSISRIIAVAAPSADSTSMSSQRRNVAMCLPRLMFGSIIA